jgi:hypothetical protein
MWRQIKIVYHDTPPGEKQHVHMGPKKDHPGNPRGMEFAKIRAKENMRIMMTS